MKAKDFQRQYGRGAIGRAAAEPDCQQPQRHTALRNAVLQVLQVNGVPAAPLWTGEGKLERGGYVKSGRRGWPDIIGHLPHGWGTYSGRALFVEVKAGEDARTEEQHAFAGAAHQAGCVYLVVRDHIESLLDTLAQLRIVGLVQEAKIARWEKAYKGAAKARGEKGG